MSVDTKNAATILRAIELLGKEIGSDAPLSYVRALMLVAQAGDSGLDQGQLTKLLDTSPSATVRAVQALGKFHWLKDEHGHKKPGLDLIDSVQDAQNFRLRRLTLTSNGKKLIAKLGGK